MTDQTVSLFIPTGIDDTGWNVTFAKNSIQCGDTIIYYKNIVSISYQYSKTFTNLIPSDQEYYFSVRAKNDDIVLRTAPAIILGSKNVRLAFDKMIYLAKALIEPILISTLVDDILNNNKTIKIGGVFITSEGYYIKKFFGLRKILWSDKIHIPTYGSGFVTVYGDSGFGKEVLENILMREDNAVLLPGLILALSKRTKNNHCT